MVARPKREPQVEPEQAQDTDWLDQLVDEMYERMKEGKHPALSQQAHGAGAAAFPQGA